MGDFEDWVDVEAYPVDDPDALNRWRLALDGAGALVLKGFFRRALVDAVLADVTERESEAFYASSTHNVWLDDGDQALPADHVVNRQVASSKGLLADDQIASHSPLRVVYSDERFRRFIAAVVGVDAVYPYADALSSVNVHFHRHGEELGWHFDNSKFAVTALIQAPESGGSFECVPATRNSATGDQNHAGVQAVLDGRRPVQVLDFAPGDLVMFRGRDTLHRVTPSIGSTTRVLVVFAFNAEPAIALSDSAKLTFYGRLG